MKQILVLLLIALASCASAPPPATDEEFEARAKAAIGVLVAPDPVQLVIMPDFVFDRMPLVRSITIKQPVNAPTITINNDDQPLGISLGNGLFMDSLNNLAVRVDLLAGVGQDFRGTTDLWRERPGSAFRVHANYDGDFITIDDSTVMANGNYRIDTKSNGQVIRGVWLSQKDGIYSILSSTPSTLAKTDTGVRKSWTEGLEFSLAGPRTMDFTYRAGRVFERGDNKLVVEQNGLYVHVSYGLGPNAAYRLYRSADGTVLINEDNGKLLIFKKTDSGLDWQTVGSGAVPPFHTEGRIIVRPAS